MSKFGKFLAGATIFTAAAVGVYEVMKKSAAKEETEDGAAGESTDFASRAYTTIRRGTEQVADKVTQEVMPRVKEAIGPKGSEVLDTIGETAGKVKDTVAESVSRVADIVRGDSHETHYSTVDSAAGCGAGEASSEADAAESSEIPVKEPEETGADAFARYEEEQADDADAAEAGLEAEAAGAGSEIPVQGPEEISEQAPKEETAADEMKDEADGGASGQNSMEDLVQQGLDMIDAAQKMSETAEQQAAEKTDAADGNTAAEDASGESFFDDNAK